MSYHYHLAPEIIRDNHLFQLEVETHLPLRLALLGLACCADRAGRFQWNPAELKRHALPYETVDFDRVMQLLVNKGFLLRYPYQGVFYGAIASPFKKTQGCHHEE